VPVVYEKEKRRMLHPKHPTKVLRINWALDALGKQFIVGAEKAV
jgi:hypothetical protein